MLAPINGRGAPFAPPGALGPLGGAIYPPNWADTGAGANGRINASVMVGRNAELIFILNYSDTEKLI
jgi:hypothetical protein